MLKPMSDQEKEAIRSLEEKGYAVVFWNNKEIEGIDKERFEEEVTAFGRETINFMRSL